jgi:hypothetical protein
MFIAAGIAYFGGGITGGMVWHMANDLRKQ